MGHEHLHTMNVHMYPCLAVLLRCADEPQLGWNAQVSGQPACLLHQPHCIWCCCCMCLTRHGTSQS